MKRTALAVILLGALGTLALARPAQAQPNVTISIGTFYDELSPHGEWIDCSYGECWVPRGIAAGWQPYSNGEWIYTRYGWTWVSSDPWGSDPFHYGTWAFIGRYGWVWVPGTIWAPAWVTWSYSDSYVGWAPMPPTVSFGRSGYSGRAVVLNEAQYVFVPTNRFVGSSVASVRVEPRRNAEIFHQAKAVTRFGVSGGIVTNLALPMATVQRGMGGKVPTRDIANARTAPRTVSSGVVGKNGHVGIVAPPAEVKAAHAARQTAAPHAAAPEPRQQPARQQEQGKQQEQAKQQQTRQQEQGKQQEQAKQQQARQQEQGKQQEQAKQQQARQQEQGKQQEQAKQQQAKQQAKQQEQGKQQPQGKQPEQARPQQAQPQPPQQHEQAKPSQGQQPQRQEQARPEQAKPMKQQPMVQDVAKVQPTPSTPQPTPQPKPEPKPTMASDPLTHPDHLPPLKPGQPQQIPQRAAPPAQGKDDGPGSKGQEPNNEKPK